MPLDGGYMGSDTGGGSVRTLLGATRRWIERPFRGPSDSSLLDWFLLVGVLIVSVALWHLIISKIGD